MFCIIAAVHDLSGGIGFQGKQPWGRSSNYRQHLSSLVAPLNERCHHKVIMGRNAFFELHDLPFFHDTVNIVVSTRWKEDPRAEIVDSERYVFAHSPAEYDCMQSKLCKRYYEGEMNGKVPTLCLVAPTLTAALNFPTNKYQKTFVVGGEQLFYEALWTAGSKELLLLEMSTERLVPSPAFDVYFPWPELLEKNRAELRAQVVEVSPPDEATGWGFRSSRMRIWSSLVEEGAERRSLWKMIRTLRYQQGLAKAHEEKEYLQLVRKVLERGIYRDDRTNTGTYSLFGQRLEFSLTDQFPLFTTKKVNFRNILEELLWFVSGSTNGKLLEEKQVNIWKDNGSREFLDQRGLQHREEGDLGPIYGFQWRHFGASYVDMHTDYSGQGVDQLMNCIRAIRERPTDRRILMSAWNPAQLQEMALPPCHVLVQFYVDDTNQALNCQMYQRSADLGLGVPYNIASYSLLTYMVAHICKLKPGKLVMVFGDAHVYSTHVNQLRKQVDREPFSFPKLTIQAREDLREIDDFRVEDFTLEDYHHHSFLYMKMAV